MLSKTIWNRLPFAIHYIFTCLKFPLIFFMHFAIFHSCLQVFYLKNSIFLMRQVPCFHYLYNILRNISREIALSHSRSPAIVYVNLPETYAQFFFWFLLRA